jgi:hypothetical protein
MFDNGSFSRDTFPENNASQDCEAGPYWWERSYPSQMAWITKSTEQNTLDQMLLTCSRLSLKMDADGNEERRHLHPGERVAQEGKGWFF